MNKTYFDAVLCFMEGLAESHDEDPHLLLHLPISLNYPWYYVDFEVRGGITLTTLKRIEASVLAFLKEKGGSLELIRVTSKVGSMPGKTVQIMRIRMICPANPIA